MFSTLSGEFHFDSALESHGDSLHLPYQCRIQRASACPGLLTLQTEKKRFQHSRASEVMARGLFLTRASPQTRQSPSAQPHWAGPYSTSRATALALRCPGGVETGPRGSSPTSPLPQNSEHLLRPLELMPSTEGLVREVLAHPCSPSGWIPGPVLYKPDQKPLAKIVPMIGDGSEGRARKGGRVLRGSWEGAPVWLQRLVTFTVLTHTADFQMMLSSHLFTKTPILDYAPTSTLPTPPPPGGLCRTSSIPAPPAQGILHGHDPRAVRVCVPQSPFPHREQPHHVPISSYPRACSLPSSAALLA